jgi:hypothetical protein
MAETLTIPHRYHGPPHSAHGGMTVGLCAELLGRRSVEVTLRAPPPLDRPMTVARDGDRLALLDGEVLVAEAGPAPELDVVPPRAVGAAEAESGAAAYLHHVDEQGHGFPTCFGCGPGRQVGEGLRIFPGTVPSGDIVAAPWIPDPALVEADEVPDRLVWAALDCPSGFAGMLLARPGSAAVLARFAGRIDALPEAGVAHTIVAWPTSTEGRKMVSDVVLVAPDGGLLAVGRALWIELAQPPAP